MFNVEPIPKRQILDSSKLKEFADDNFKFDENGRKLSKRVENTVGKGKIAPYEQFLLFPQCFQTACFPEASKGVIVWEWFKTACYISYDHRLRGQFSFRNKTSLVWYNSTRQDSTSDIIGFHRFSNRQFILLFLFTR